MGSHIHDGLELEAVEVWCNAPNCIGKSLRGEEPTHRPATRFFRSKIDNSGQPGTDPAPGEKFYFGRCEEHADSKVLNHDLVEECSREEYIAAKVMNS